MLPSAKGSFKMLRTVSKSEVRLDEKSILSTVDASNSVRNFCEARDWDQFHSPKDLAIGLTTESAELLELFRFKSEDQISEMLVNAEDRGKVADELADVYFFLLRFCQRNGFDLNLALEKKIEKNELKYPVDKARGSNKKYDQF